MLAGAALRLCQYLANSSLWIDEAALGRNIIERPAAELFGPLHYAQAAPIGFLLLEKWVISMFGASEYALRLFPLIAGLGALFLFVAVARRIVAGWAAPFAVGIFALGIPFVYFSSQVKQYSSDISAALLLLLLAIDLEERRDNRLRTAQFAVVGTTVIWISQSAVFVAAGIAAALLVLCWVRAQRPSRSLIVALSAWLVSMAAVAFQSMSAIADMDREYLNAFWREGFMPMPPATLDDLLWLPNKLIWVFGAFGSGLGYMHGGLNYRWSPVFAATVVYGYWTLWRNHSHAALFLLLPVVAAIGAAAANLYPFTARLLAFVIPFFLLALAAGAGGLLANLPRRLEFASPVALAILGGAPVFAIATALPPSWVQHLRPGLQHLRQHQQPGDRIYVYPGAEIAFRYYAPRLGISTAETIYGKCTIHDPRKHLRQLDGLRGVRRVWIVMTHEVRRGEREFILGYLDALGTQLNVIEIPASSKRTIERASVHLYDLITSSKHVDAENFPVPAPMQAPSDGMLKWGCYGVTGGEPTAQTRP